MMRRSTTAPPRGLEERRRRWSYGPGGLPSEGLDPAPKARPWASWLALAVCVCFLGLQLWPAARFRQPADPSRVRFLHTDERQQSLRNNDVSTVEKELTLEKVRRQWDPEFVETTGDSNTVSTGPPRAQSAGLAGHIETSSLTKHQLQDLKVWEKIQQKIHVFLSSDEKDMRPLAVVINSTLQNSGHPDRIVFHLVVPMSESNLSEFYKLKALFSAASIELFRGSFNFSTKLLDLIQFRNDSHAREELSSPYNFVPYHLPQMYEDVELMVYLDTDVVVKGDIEELYTTNLEDHPVAAVEDCSQRFSSYFDFEQLNAIQEAEPGNPWLPPELFDEETCVFNRGVLLINATRWTELEVTGAIEWWMEKFHQAEKPLYRYGLSQPPFLLALCNKNKKLEHAWNNRGLGRDRFSKLELEYFAARYKDVPNHKPFLSLESDFAKVLPA